MIWRAKMIWNIWMFEKDATLLFHQVSPPPPSSPVASRNRLTRVPSSPKSPHRWICASAPAGRFNVACAFVCPCTSESECPIGGKDSRGKIKKIAWGLRGDAGRLADGGVDASEGDWFCERVYRNLWQHRFSRKALKAKMAEDKNVLDQFQEDRTHLVEHLKKGLPPQPCPANL